MESISVKSWKLICSLYNSLIKYGMRLFNKSNTSEHVLLLYQIERQTTLVIWCCCLVEAYEDWKEHFAHINTERRDRHCKSQVSHYVSSHLNKKLYFFVCFISVHSKYLTTHSCYLLTLKCSYYILMGKKLINKTRIEILYLQQMHCH